MQFINNCCGKSVRGGSDGVLVVYNGILGHMIRGTWAHGGT